jgi:hypothetical protein
MNFEAAIAYLWAFGIFASAFGFLFCMWRGRIIGAVLGLIIWIVLVAGVAER